MEYNFREIEKKWQDEWRKQGTYKVANSSDKPKYYVLDMFPYPSGAGLHVGHPLGYIASDIVARYKRLNGFNVLHPMGYDSFGLPAEQYAIQTGQHPKKTTEDNIARYREQLDKIGFSFDWSREVRTSDPSYYKWTQWIFLKIFGSWYNCKTDKAEPIETLIAVFEKEGFNGETHRVLTGDIEHEVQPFTAEQWKNFSEKEKSDILMNFRLAYLGNAWVNWCPALGTVLANDEVKDGVSERGGYPVERKQMPQWSMRITAYADRLLRDLDALDWTESMKDAQRNWIGKSEGTSLKFKGAGVDYEIEVFTTRPDTIFGVSFVTLAPEHELVQKITTAEYKAAVDAYVTMAKNRSERERMADVKKITGQFTGAYVIHPFSGAKIPVWIGDYVLAGYGTGAVMAVPAHDSRDYAFAKHFQLPIIEVVSGGDISKESYDAKEGKLINSDFLNGLEVKEAVKRAIEEIEKRNLGQGKTNYRLRDAAFGRQRYWGEPIPIYYKDGIPTPLPEDKLPLVLPEIEKFLPTETGEPPLGRATDWKYEGKYEYELTTMPGWAGSSWYYLRYMDPHNANELVSKEAVNYWKNIDYYGGGAEHATGHLLYVRFWTKFLYDIGKIPFNEPAQKLVNQGMIQGVSAFTIAMGSIFSFGHQNNKPLPFDLLKAKHPIIFISKTTAEKFSIDKSVQDRILDFYEECFKKHNKDLQQFTRDTDYKLKLDLTYPQNYFVPLHVPVEFVLQNDELDIAKFKEWRKSWSQNEILEIFPGDQVTFICSREVEKMSKSKWNVINPDQICNDYGADTLRLYEMFLGPLEQAKPWNTNGITGVHNFLKRFWRLFYADAPRTAQPTTISVSDETPSEAELKTLHRALKKIKDDLERGSYNTCVSSFMIATNELMELKCHKRTILEPLVIALSPFAPHIAEELWSQLGHSESITTATFPVINEKYLVDDSFSYPVQVNGKVRFNFTASLQLSPAEVEKEVLSSEEAQKWLEGKTPKKVIVVPKRIVNIVV
jgi:leucyl-tRNA synthetase